MDNFKEMVELTKQHVRRPYDPRIPMHPNHYETIVQYENRLLSEQVSQLIYNHMMEMLLYGNAYPGTDVSPPLLLHKLPSWSAPVLPEQRGPGWSEEAFRMQVLRSKVPVQMSSEGTALTS